jgi:hypothetical protein
MRTYTAKVEPQSDGGYRIIVTGSSKQSGMPMPNHIHWLSAKDVKWGKGRQGRTPDEMADDRARYLIAEYTALAKRDADLTARAWVVRP